MRKKLILILLFFIMSSAHPVRAYEVDSYIGGLDCSFISNENISPQSSKTEYFSKSVPVKKYVGNHYQTWSINISGSINYNPNNGNIYSVNANIINVDESGVNSCLKTTYNSTKLNYSTSTGKCIFYPVINISVKTYDCTYGGIPPFTHIFSGTLTGQTTVYLH